MATYSLQDYQIIDQIGEGVYSIVYKGKNKTTGEFVALKRIKFDFEEEGIPTTAVREIALLKELNHPNITPLQDVIIDPPRLFLIFEYLPIDLKTYISSLGNGVFMDQIMVKSYLYQISSAIKYCHQRHFLHRDLKPENLLIDQTGIIKVADFGLGRAYSIPPRAYSQEVVTLWYRAPELLLGLKRYACSVDIWSVGCIFAEMATSDALFEGTSEINQLHCIFKILRTPTEDLWPGVSALLNDKITFPIWKFNSLRNQVRNLDADGFDLLQKMLVYNPKNRVSAKEALTHPYFRDVSLPPGLQLSYVLNNQNCPSHSTLVHDTS